LVGFWDVHGQGGGVAVSTDRGQTFSIAAGLEGESVRALALAPSDPRIAVAGTLSGVFTSRERGLSWRRISPEGHAELRNIEAVAIDPRDPRLIYAGTWHLPWKTFNGGTTWIPLHDGMADDSDVVNALAALPDGTLLLGAEGAGVLRSHDRGRTWTCQP
jgi:photosystem II stability/assembly factor-like uncharacterized protein